MTIGELMREHREALRLNQSDVARALGVNRATVNRWEKGRIDIDRKRIEDICNVLHIDPLIFCHPNEVIFPDERQLIEAWREADELTRAMVRRALNIEEKKDISQSEASSTY